MSKKNSDKEIFVFEEDDSGSGEAGGSSGATGVGVPPLPPEDPHGELFREASVRGRLRAEEGEFGKVLAEKNIDAIFVQLLEKWDMQNAAQQEAALDSVLAAHPLLDSQMFDGIEDSNPNPSAITDPEQRRELENRLENKKQLKLQLQQRLGMTAPRPMNS
jgi:hypothetical protein